LCVGNADRTTGRQRKEGIILEAESTSTFDNLLDEIRELSAKKRKDYGTDYDPFANVRASSDWGIPAWIGAMVRATDKVRRLQQYAKKGSLENEGARDSFLDLAVYALIACLLWQEDQDQSTTKNP
jgi:hypothetical protein